MSLKGSHAVGSGRSSLVGGHSAPSVLDEHERGMNN